MNYMKHENDSSATVSASVAEKIKLEEYVPIDNAVAIDPLKSVSATSSSQVHTTSETPEDSSQTNSSAKPIDFKKVKEKRSNCESFSSCKNDGRSGREIDSSKRTTGYSSSSPTATASPSSSTPAPTHSQHHPHQSYPQYYPPYSHGHTPYYYPPGPYYPPPPAHGAHQAYAPHSHYYAHYPPPPGYYPPPHPYYYPQPPAATTSSKEPSRGGKSSPACISTSSSQQKPKIPSPSSTISTLSSTSKSPIRGPYSAFSCSSNSRKPHPPKTLVYSSQPKNSVKSKPIVNAVNKKRKATQETNAIFRANAKRTKQLAAETKAIAAAIAAKRAQSKEKAKKELSQTVLDRRARKNAQSRLRASKLKDRIATIQAKAPEDRTPEEVKSLEVFEERRQRKNGRSRERATERKREYERIMAIPEHLWSPEEKNFVQETMIAKFKKNEGDRMRRKKLKDEYSSTGNSSISSDFDTANNYSFSESNSIPNTVRHASTDSGIPDYVDSTNNNNSGDENFTLEGFVQSLSSKDAPLTPVTQREAYSLLESTPTAHFGTMSNGNKNGNCFSPNFIFPSPTSKNCRDFSANMDSIDFDSLELPTVGASILDQSMAMTIDDEVIYSPNLQPPCLNENECPQPNEKHSMPQLTPNIRLSPVNLPRRSPSRGETGYSAFSEIPTSCEDMKNCDGDNSNAIAVSFSVDTA